MRAGLRILKAPSSCSGAPFSYLVKAIYLGLTVLSRSCRLGILSYLGVTGGFSDSTFDYTGVVHDASKHPVADAEMQITEGQKVPQIVTTDSKGVFHARLLKKTLNIRIVISAEGFEPISLYVQTLRTGAEPITLPTKIQRPDGHSATTIAPQAGQQSVSNPKEPLKPFQRGIHTPRHAFFCRII